MEPWKIELSVTEVLRLRFFFKLNSGTLAYFSLVEIGFQMPDHAPSETPPWLLWITRKEAARSSQTLGEFCLFL